MDSCARKGSVVSAVVLGFNRMADVDARGAMCAGVVDAAPGLTVTTKETSSFTVKNLQLNKLGLSGRVQWCQI